MNNRTVADGCNGLVQTQKQKVRKKDDRAIDTQAVTRLEANCARFLFVFRFRFGRRRRWWCDGGKRGESRIGLPLRVVYVDRQQRAFMCTQRVEFACRHALRTYGCSR